MKRPPRSPRSARKASAGSGGRSPARARKAAPAAPAAARAPTYDDLLAIARLVESGSRFTEFRLRSGDIEVEVKRAPEEAARAAPAAPAPSAPATVSPVTPAPVPAAQAAAPAAPVAASSPRPASVADLPPGTQVVTSPMVGTFYRAPEPGAKPFVEVGSKVRPDTIVCIVEVMKLMNSVTAGVAGTVTHILADNTQMVETGQPLVAIWPA